MSSVSTLSAKLTFFLLISSNPKARIPEAEVPNYYRRCDAFQATPRLAICQVVCYNEHASRGRNPWRATFLQYGDVGFRQAIRLENCRSRCRYALSLNNRQN